MKTAMTVLTIVALCVCVWAADNAVAGAEPTVNPQSLDAITIPQMLSYQGKLTDTFGLPVVDTTYSVDFRLYSMPSGGTPYWNETQTVRTRAGLFSTLLGSVTPVDSVPDTGEAYLGMAVEGGPELAPRLRIASAAYAYAAARAASADLLQGKDTAALDVRYVNEGQASSVTSNMMVDGTIAAVDLGQMGASSGQVMKWTGSAWAPANDSVGSGGSGTVTKVAQTTGVVCSPNPITDSGMVGFDSTWGDARFVNEAQAAGGGLTGTYPSPTIAANAVGSVQIIDGSVTSADIRDTTVNTAELKEGAVTTEKIAANAVTSAKIERNANTGYVLTSTGSGSDPSWQAVPSAPNHQGDITGPHSATVIADGAVTSAKILDATVGSADIRDTTVNTSDIKDAAVTAPKLNQMGATTSQVLKWTGSAWAPGNDSAGVGSMRKVAQSTGIVCAPNPITDSGTVRFDSTWGDARFVNEAQVNGVTAPMITDTNVTMAKIAQAGATPGQVVKWTGSAWAPGQDSVGGGSGVTNVYQDTGITCVPNPITSTGNVKLDLAYTDARYVNEAQANSVTGEMIADGQISSADIRDTTITTAKLKDDAVTSAKILDATVSSADIRDTTVNTGDLKDAAVTMPKLNQAGATSGQVIKWNGSAWAPANDSIGSGGGGTVTKVVQTTGVVCSPNPITDSGTVGFDSAWGDARFVNEAQANSVTGAMIIDGQVSSADIRDTTVNTAELKDGAVTSVKILDANVTSAHLRDTTVNTSDIKDAAVTAPKLNQMGAAGGQVLKWTGSAWAPANDSVGSGGGGTVLKVAQSTGVVCSPNPITDSGTVRFDSTWGDARFVNESQAAGGGLTGTYPSPTIAADAVSSDNIVDGSITAADIRDTTIATAKLKDDAVTSAKILDAAVTSADIRDTTVNTSDIKDAAVTAPKLNQMGAAGGQVLKWTGSVWAPGNDSVGTGGSGTVRKVLDATGVVCSPNPITDSGTVRFDTTWGDARFVNESQAAGGGLTGTYPNPTIAADAVSSGNIVDGSITSADIRDTTVTTADMKDDAITSAKILDEAVTSADIRDTTVSTVDLKDAAVTMPKLNQAGASSGQVIKWTGSAWAPRNDSLGGGSVVSVSQATGVVCNPNPITTTGTVGFDTTWGDARFVNESQAAGGDLAGTYPDPTLANSGVSAGTYGSATQVGQFAVNAKGQLTSAGNVSISGVPPGGPAGGGLTGTYPSPTIAADAVSSGNVVDGSITSADIRDTTVATADVKDDAITSAKILDAAVTSADIRDTTVNTGDLKDAAVTMSKLNQAGAASGQVIKWTGSAWAPGNDSVGAGGGGTVTKVVQSTGVVCSPNPITDSGTVRFDSTWGDARFVNEAQANSVDGPMIVDGQVSSADIRDTTVNTVDLKDDAVTSAKILDAAVTSADIRDTTVNTADIKDAAVTAPKLNQMGATGGQVLKWTGSAWAPGNDSVGGGGGTVRKVVQATGIVCSPNPIADSGTVRFDSTWGDARFVNEGQPAGGGLVGLYPSPAIAADAVSSGNILDGSVASADIRDTTLNTADIKDAAITAPKLSQMGAAGGQVLKWTGSAWAPANDSVGGAGDNAWVRRASPNDSILWTAHNLGIARGGAGDTLIGTLRYTHVNLGTASATGATGQNHSSCTVGGGNGNTASGDSSVVAGGSSNIAGGMNATVAGGYSNLASGAYAQVGGGYDNEASDEGATVGGGEYNTADGYGATIGGGEDNFAGGVDAAVPGGYGNMADGDYSFAVGDGSEVPVYYDNSAAFNGEVADDDYQVRCDVLKSNAMAYSLDDPLDPVGTIMNQFAVGSPEIVVTFRGSAVVGTDGRVVADLPPYFDALCRNPMVQLTGVGTHEVYVADKVAGNRFIIGGRPGTEVYWTVTGERKDQLAEITRIRMPVQKRRTGALVGRSISDANLIGALPQLQRLGLDGRFSFRTAAGRQRYEDKLRRTREIEQHERSRPARPRAERKQRTPQPQPHRLER